MIDQEIKHIICAVRGGPESRETVTHAIDLALKHEARLTFFHALDAEFLGTASLSMAPVRSVYQQLHEMGEFSMLILCDRATRRGVEMVNYQVREGNIQNLLREKAIETKADVMVMGRPVRSPGSNVFTDATFDQFISEMEKDADLKMVVIIPKILEETDNASRPGILPP